MEKMRQIPLGGVEPDAIGEETERAVAEADAAQSERDAINKAMEEYGFLPDKPKKTEGRKAWLALGKKLRGEDEKIS